MLKKYDFERISIATIGSHSALQILSAAKKYGFKSIVICKRGYEIIYKKFNVADEIMVLNDYREILSENVQEKLLNENSIIIPHGSFVAYLGYEGIKRIKSPIFGNREVFKIEMDRKLEREFLKKSGLKLPKEINPKDINRLCIVKLPGAKGGKGYFLVRTYDEFVEKIKNLKIDFSKITIQEYIYGANIYFSYFYSPIRDEVEFYGADRRYETNVDSIGRVPAKYQDVEPSYVVVGNFPVLLRESLLKEVIKMGENVVKASKEMFPPGIIGPFCLECIIDENFDIYTFEISVRIVAGTNVFITGSPYYYIMFGRNINMGERIMMEIREAIERNILEKIVT